MQGGNSPALCLDANTRFTFSDPIPSSHYAQSSTCSITLISFILFLLSF